MANSKNNVVMQGTSGTIGRMLVYRNSASGKTIIARRPKKTLIPPTADQEAVKEKFTEASFYAKNAIASPELKAAYKAKAKPGQSAFNVAFADYMKPPQLKKVFADSYNGTIGDKITFRVIDVLEVKSVKIRILSATDVLLEQGNAVLDPNGMDWIYTSTVANPTIEGTQLEVTMKDTPNNVAQIISVLEN